MKLSVCMATYNGEKYIKAQLDSILCQIKDSDEVIISDDGSTDSTLSIINDYHDARIKIYHHHKQSQKFNFAYTTKNFENALEKSAGDVIFLADQDDIWAKDKIEVCMKALENSDLILHDCTVVNKNNKQITPSYFKLNQSKPGIFKNIVKNSYLGCCMAIKKSLLNLVLPFPQDKVPHDIWIGLIAEKYGKVQFLQEKLVRYRRHGDNLSASGEKSPNSLFFKLYYRIVIFKALLLRIMQIKKADNNENSTSR